MNEILSQLNSLPMYAICGGIIAFVALICIIFMVRAYRAGVAIGMEPAVLKRAITSSATFSVLPSIGILLGVVALSGSLGTPWPWLRLSVIGALHYETQVAQAAAEQTGMSSLTISEMTPESFVTIALLMGVCIMWGMLLSALFNKRYLQKISKKSDSQKKDASERTSEKSFGDSAMTAMFIGLISAYLGSYIGTFVSGNGLFTFTGTLLPLLVVAASALAMAFFLYLVKKKQMLWIDNFSLAGSMLFGMISAVVIQQLF